MNFPPIRRRMTPALANRINIPKRYQSARLPHIPEGDPKQGLTAYLMKIKEMAKDGTGLYLWGPNGTGKTYALAVVVRAVFLFGYSSLFLDATEFRKSLMDRTIMFDEGVSVIDRCETVDFLGLDDVGQEYRSANSGFVESMLGELLRHRVNHNRCTCLTTNLNYDQFTAIYGQSTAGLVLDSMVPIKMEAGIAWRPNRAQAAREKVLG